MKVKPKYMQIVEDILDKIDRKIYLKSKSLESESTLQSYYGVSRDTVRKALKYLSDNNIINLYTGKKAVVSDYKKEQFKLNKQFLVEKVIGVIMPDLINFSPIVIDSIKKEAEKFSFKIIERFVTDSFVEAKVIKEMIEKKVDGIIITPIRYYNNYDVHNYRLLELSRKQFVMIGKPPNEFTSSCVYANDVCGIYDSIMKMKEEGIKNICHVTNTLLDKESVYERIEGYNIAIKKLGNDYTNNIIDLKNDQGENKLRFLIKNSNIRTGLILYDDLMAETIYKYCLKYNKNIPKDIAIIGYSNGPVCEKFSPKLSSIEVSHDLLGKWGVRLLAQKFERNTNKLYISSYEQMQIRPYLVKRESF